MSGLFLLDSIQVEETENMTQKNVQEKFYSTFRRRGVGGKESKEKYDSIYYYFLFAKTF